MASEPIKFTFKINADILEPIESGPFEKSIREPNTRITDGIQDAVAFKAPPGARGSLTLWEFDEGLIEEDNEE